MKFRVFCISMTMFVLAINTSNNKTNNKLPDNSKSFANKVYAGGSFGKAKSDCENKGGKCLDVGCESCVFDESASGGPISVTVIKPKLPVKEAVVDFGLIVDKAFEDKKTVCQLLSEECSSCNNMVVTMEYPPKKTTRTEICRLISPECRSCENIVAAL